MKFDLIFSRDDDVMLALRELGGKRVCIFKIDSSLAGSLTGAKRGMKDERPNTHDLIVELLKQADLKVQSISIEESINTILRARIRVEFQNNFIDLDSRPSDAFILSLKLNCPFHVDEQYIRADPGYDKARAELISRSGVARLDEFAGRDPEYIAEQMFKRDQSTLPKA